MRSEQEILDLIVNTARDDERIRAVIMNGSRVNPNAPRDVFQDFDVVYLVWESLFAMYDLFRRVAVSIADHFGFEYPHADDRNVSAHLVHVRHLPRDAQAMYA